MECGIGHIQFIVLLLLHPALLLDLCIFHLVLDFSKLLFLVVNLLWKLYILFGSNFLCTIHSCILNLFMSVYRETTFSNVCAEQISIQNIYCFLLIVCLLLMLFMILINRTATYGNQSQGYFCWNICCFVLLR